MTVEEPRLREEMIPPREPEARAPAGWRRRLAPLVVILVVAAIVAVLALLFAQYRARTNTVTLASMPKGVSVVEAKATEYRPTRRYVGTLRAWQRAEVGPQLVSAYLQTVLVRPGDVVERGQVLATLDCRNASAGSQRAAMQAKALERQQRALASEAARLEGLVDEGFVSPNEVEKKVAASAAAEAELHALRAQLGSRSLEVGDCVLRAPFDGEIASRRLDPGAFVRPGATVLTVVDRTMLRLDAEVPEKDYHAVAPTTPVELRLIATGQRLSAEVSRRSPAANPSTRTVHIEIDLTDADRRLPVGTTGEVSVEIGEPVVAAEVPLRAAVVRGATASLFLAEGDTARKIHARVLGERGPRLFLEPILPAGTLVVVEGRSSLSSGDRIATAPDRTEASRPPGAAPGPPAARNGARAAADEAGL